PEHGSPPAWEAQLPPRLVGRHRRRVGKVHAATGRQHRDPQLRGDPGVRQGLLVQAGGLRTEEEDVTAAELHVRKPGARLRRESEDPGPRLRATCRLLPAQPGQMRGRGLEILVEMHIRQVVIIQPGAADVLLLEVEAQWARQVQCRPGARTHADSIARIRRDLWLIEQDMEGWIGGRPGRRRERRSATCGGSGSGGLRRHDTHLNPARRGSRHRNTVRMEGKNPDDRARRPSDDERGRSDMADAPKDATPQGKKTPTGGTQRPVDITLFGATGFIGKILAGWLAEHAPKDVTIALAGRNREKLVFLKQQLLTVHQGVMDWRIVEADAFDEDAMTELAKNTRVVISTVGPFVRYGEDLVRACAEAGTHYVDSTGEVLFMRKMIDKYDDVAKAHGARIIHACGFDSVPSDIGMLLINEAAAKDGKKLAEVTNLVSMRGAMSGGTVESAREQFQAAQRDPEQGRLLADPY